MHFRAMHMQLILLMAPLSLVCSFVLMESDSKELDEGEIEERIIYLIKILQRVKELTDPELSARQQLTDPDLDPELLSASQIIDPELSEKLLAELTDRELSEGRNPDYLDSKDLDIRTLADKLKEAKWPVDNSYERVIDIQKKDFAILPPSSEWCRMMGFRRCRNGATS